MRRPCRGFLLEVGTVSHPDRVGVGYDLPRLRGSKVKLARYA